MNMKKIIGLALAIVVVATSLTGCELVSGLLGGGAGNDGGTATGKSTLVMEAEYTKMDDVIGAGLSDNTSGLSMIYGDGTNDDWSNGYFVGYMHNDRSVLTFEFKSSKATSATITFAIGCEYNDMVLQSGENIAILVNGVEQSFNWSVECSELSDAEFSNYYLNNIQLKEGDNKIEIKILPQDPKTYGPLVDCVKVVATDADLSWEPNEDNPYRRDNEV